MKLLRFYRFNSIFYLNSRILFIWKECCIRFPQEIVKELRLLNSDSFIEALNGLVEEVKNHIGIQSLTDLSREKIRDEIWRYYQNGSCREKETYDVCVKLTMLDPMDLSWQVFHNPFDSYLPLVGKELSLSRSWI